MFYPRNSTPWAKELPSSTSHSNRSLRTEVFVAGKRNFQRGDKEAETTLEIQRRRCRDKITLGNSANSGLIARFRESRLERECVVGPGGPTQANTFSDLLRRCDQKGSLKPLSFLTRNHHPVRQ